jgi:LPXTG-motif cell wall-anchored protein
VRRFSLAILFGVLGALMVGAPAGAQYEQPPTTPTTAPGEEPSGDPENPRIAAGVSDDDVQPGDTVTVTAPPAFAPGTQVTVYLARAQEGSAALALATAAVNADGSVNRTVTIPDVPAGVYYLYIVGVDEDGNERIAITAIVVRNAQAAAASVEAPAPESFESAAVPAAVAELQPALSPAAEAAVVDAVTDGAGVVLSPADGALSIQTPAGLQDATTLPTTGANDVSQQVTIGAALLLAGTGLVLLRRRRGGFTQ